MAQKLETRRQDLRLDTFLRRNLSWKDYERIIISEPCVILSPEEKRVYRHVILGQNCLFSTEDPPKSLKTVLKLVDIESIHKLEDLPDFLSGEEQHNTVHIQICYTRPASPAARERRFLSSLGSRKSPVPKRHLKEKGEEQQEEERLSPGSNVEFRIQSAEMEKTSPTSRRSPQLSHQESKYHQLVTVSSSSSSRSRMQRSPTQRSPPGIFVARSNLEVAHYKDGGSSSNDYDEESPLNKEPSHSPYELRRASLSSKMIMKHEAEDAQKKYSSSSRHLTVSPKHLASSTGNLSVKDRTSSINSLSSTWSKTSRDTSLGSTSGTLSFKERTSSQPELRVGGENPNPSDVLSLSLDYATTSKSLTKSQSFGSSTGFLSTNVSREVVTGAASKTELAVADLYILKQATDFYHRLKASWESVKINQVLKEGLGNSDHDSTHVSSAKSHDHFCQQFCTLKEDLLSATQLESCAELAQELTSACQKYFFIKTLFWEDPEILEFCTKQLDHYLRTCKSHSKQLEDHVVYAIILMDLLSQMMREVFTSKKLSHLTCNSGQPLLSLARAITYHFPLLDIIGHTHGVELTEKACALVYELMLTADQARWPLAKKTNVSTSWFVKTLANSDELHHFYLAMLQYASQVLSNSHIMSPQEQVTLYQIGIVLSTLLRSSPFVVQFFKQHFTEEFKYYINTSKLKVLSGHYPLITDTLKLLHTCKSKVLFSK